MIYGSFNIIHSYAVCPKIYIYICVCMYVCIYRYNYVLFYVAISPVLSGFIMWCIYLYCPSVDEVILANMGKIDSYQTTTKHNRTSTIFLILGVYYIPSNLWYKLHQIPKFKMFFVSSFSCLCSIHWSQVLSREWRYSWSNADRRCSNYIWMINDFIAY